MDEAQQYVSRLKGLIIVPPARDRPGLDEADEGRAVTLVLDGRLVRPDGRVGISVLWHLAVYYGLGASAAGRQDQQRGLVNGLV